MACNRPFSIKDKQGNIVTVPCGWCRQCRIDKRNEWTMRLAFDVSANSGCFITLTYDSLYLPHDAGLHKEHLQKFFKRFRTNLYRGNYPKKIKYYAVGEYGELGTQQDVNGTGFGRPHYHAIVSGISPLAAQKFVRDSWQLGFIMVKAAEVGSIRYVLKYLDKELHGKKELALKYGALQPPFAVMSKGIGIDYLRKNSDVIDYFDGVPFNGSIRPIPRYYLDHFDFQHEKGMSPVKRSVVLDYMKSHNCTVEKALNDLGEINERDLAARDRLFHS